MTDKLPPPKQWALCKMNEMEVAELIEKHIDYYAVDKDGNERSVHLPMPFVRHFMRRSDGVLPTTAAYATMPLVLADGNVLSVSGLDRTRGIQFLIPDEIRAVVPHPQDCTPEAVKKAMTYLTDEWLVDVAAGYEGKAVIVAAALTLIERSLLAERPCFFFTAGRRGGGKTTAITMLVMAVVGLRPAASAWSSNEEERRKALMAHFLYGMPYILWDNIPRGSQISCPHVERSCTSAYYSDRRLGVSEIAQAAASTIHLFTGNNVGAKGDLASRSLFVRLEVNRADPENREFKHPDPIDWTTRHRGKILAALYTILLGNPEIRKAHDAPAQTRFKIWWRLVGSAVEHAAGRSGEELSFKTLFLAREEDDEDSTSLAEVLEVLLVLWPKNTFTALSIASLTNDRNRDADQTGHGQSLRDFLMPGALDSHVFSAKSIGKKLKNHLDEPVFSGNRTLTLCSKVDLHTHARSYWVKVQVGGKVVT